MNNLWRERKRTELWVVVNYTHFVGLSSQALLTETMSIETASNRMGRGEIGKYAQPRESYAAVLLCGLRGDIAQHGIGFLVRSLVQFGVFVIKNKVFCPIQGSCCCSGT
jgi:hypothetical protein